MKRSRENKLLKSTEPVVEQLRKSSLTLPALVENPPKSSFNQREFEARPCPFPEHVPADLYSSYGAAEKHVYDASIHLDLSAPLPETNKNLILPNDARPNQQLAYTAPFKVLSAEGIRAVRDTIFDMEKFASSNERQPKSLRGAAYRSKFLRDIAYCPYLIAHLAVLAGVNLQYNALPMNCPQINFGEIGSEEEVDIWHLDSVPYVLVILLSDATDMVGGELRVARLPDPKEALKQVQADEVDPAFVDTAVYPAQGHGIFMQGSRIAHCVTPVQAAREKRLTMVLSYDTLNPFTDNQVIYHTYHQLDPRHIAEQEIARVYAWRVQGRLQYVLEKGIATTSEGKKEILQILDEAKEELAFAAALIREEKIDTAPYKKKQKD